MRRTAKSPEPLILREVEIGYQTRASGSLLRNRKTYRLIDWFAGAVGMTRGFTKSYSHIFEPVWANDFNEDAAATCNENFGPHCVCGDTVGILEDPATEIPTAAIVIGGPPCQGFSMLNKERESVLHLLGSTSDISAYRARN